jgi:SHAQKYF class myb-like DNA-binding protein
MKRINPKNSEEEGKNEKSIYFLGKKKIHFVVKKYTFIKNESSIKKHKKNLNEGRWSYTEQIKFIKALSKDGPNWKKIKEAINFRTLKQIRSHAQKLFKRLKRCKNKILGIDFTTNSIKSFKDMINHIKSVNCNYDINKVFLYLSDINQKSLDELSKKMTLKELPRLVNAILCCEHEEMINKQKNYFNKIKMNISNMNSQHFNKNNNKLDLSNLNKILLLNSLNNMNNKLNALILNYLNESITPNNLNNKYNNNIPENKNEALFNVTQSSNINSLYSLNDSDINQIL